MCSLLSGQVIVINPSLKGQLCILIILASPSAYLRAQGLFCLSQPKCRGQVSVERSTPNGTSIPLFSPHIHMQGSGTSEGEETERFLKLGKTRENQSLLDMAGPLHL